MTDSRTPLDERISALMDGAFNAQECPGALQQVLADPEGARVWHSYHVVGDVLRSGELVPIGGDHAFWAKLSCKLVQEPGRPQWRDESFAEPLASEAPPDTTRVAANAAVWKWKLLAGAAGSALVAVVGLGLWAQQAAPGGLQLAAQANPESVQAFAAVEGEAGVMLRDPHLDQLMAAHQQLGGHSALQAPSGFLRNATYQGTGR
jgi:sigma-E factor negative regulatory protein RseA